jgi:AraC-like DNA-binding protein
MKTRREGFPDQRLYRIPQEYRERAEALPGCREFLVTDLGFFPEAAGHQVDRPEGYPAHVLLFCVSGKGWVTSGAQSMELGAGDVVWIPPELPHVYGADRGDPWRVYWVHVEGRRADDWWSWFASDAEQGLRWRVSEATQLAERFERVWRMQDAAGSDVSLIRMSTESASLLAEAVAGRETEDAASRVLEARVDRSVEWMREHLGEKIRLEDCAKAAGMSASHYSAVFREVTGVSPIRYVNRLRLRQGAEWLDTTGLSVQEIADRLGYGNPFHFSKAFREFSGLSPRAYRGR